MLWLRQRDWVRLRRFAKTGDPFVEASRCALFLDTFTWPAAAHAHIGDPRFIAPTLSFAIDFHQQTDSEWLLSDAYSPHAGDGLIAMHQRLWSPMAGCSRAAAAPPCAAADGLMSLRRT